MILKILANLRGTPLSKLKKILTDSKYLTFCIYVASAAFLLYLLFFIIRNFGQILSAVGSGAAAVCSALSPLFIGLVAAYLLMPLVELVDGKVISRCFPVSASDPIRAERSVKKRRTVSVLVTFILILLLICVLIYSAAALVMGQITFQSMDKTAEALQNYFLQYKHVLDDLAERIPDSGLQDRAQEIVTSIVQWVSDHFSLTAVFLFLSSLSNGFLNFILGIVVAFYLIKDKDFFLRLWRKIVHVCIPMKAASYLNEALSDVNTVLSRFLRGQLLDALIIAVLSSVALTACGLEFSVFIGCFAGLANIIPYFGPFLGMIPAFLSGFLTDGWQQAILAVALLLVIQQIDGNIIYPKVVGSSIGLHPMFVLLAVTVGGYFFGIIGMLLAVPIAGILKLFLSRLIERKSEQQASE